MLFAHSFFLTLFHTFNLFSEDEQIDCTVNRLNKSCLGLFPPFFCVCVCTCEGGVSGILSVFIPRRHKRRLAVVNEPKWSPVIRRLIWPLGARERSGGWWWGGRVSSQLLVPEGAQVMGRWGRRWEGRLVSFPSIRGFNGVEALLLCFPRSNDASGQLEIKKHLTYNNASV